MGNGAEPSGSPTRKILRIFRPPHKGDYAELDEPKNRPILPLGGQFYCSSQGRNKMDWTGVGIAVLFGFLAFAVKDMPPALAWGGVAFGIILAVWKHIPLDQKYNGPLIIAAAIFVLASAATAWTLSISREVQSVQNVKTGHPLGTSKPPPSRLANIPPTASSSTPPIPPHRAHHHKPPQVTAPPPAPPSLSETALQAPIASAPVSGDQKHDEKKLDCIVTSKGQSGGVTTCNVDTVNQ